MNKNEQKAYDLMRKCLSKFPLYEESQPLVVAEKKGSLHISYRELNYNHRFNQNSFDIQIEKGVCYILWMGIRQNLRKKGYGRKLLSSIEDFCENLGGVEVLHVNPSGQGLKAWPRMGFM